MPELLPEFLIAAAWCACGIAGVRSWSADGALPWRDAALGALLGPVAVLAGLLVRHGLPPELFAERRLRPIPVRVRERRRR